MTEGQRRTAPALSKGTVIKGKWSSRSWVVHSTLGVGANGSVYSVAAPGEKALEALKTSGDSGAVAFEWGILTQLHRLTHAFPEPRCIDDSAQPCALYFYVMEQVEGVPLQEAWHRMSEVELQKTLLGLGRGLHRLHSAGYAFCDVKPQNVIVNAFASESIRFVDVGGVTPFGRSVRQFTPTSDCAYWGYGPRRASAAYDLMAIALMIVCLENPPPQDIGEWPLQRRNDWMRRALRKTTRIGLPGILESVLNGRIDSATDWNRLIVSRRGTVPKKTVSTPISSRAASVNPNRTKADWSERLMWISLGCAMISTTGAWTLYLNGL